MTSAILLGSDGFRKGMVSLVHHKVGPSAFGALIEGVPYQIKMTSERTKPENYAICDVYAVDCPVPDEYKQTWQIAMPEEKALEFDAQYDPEP